MPDLCIGGAWRAARDGGTREVRCPADGSLVATVDEATPADVAEAVAAARHAFDDGPWPRTPVRDRATVLAATADLLAGHGEEIARAESLDTGKRLVESRYDVADVVSVFRYYADLVASGDAGRVVDTGLPHVHSRVQHEPVGVCALVTPWNYPLLQAAWKVAPALAAGNTFVLKPSELTPSTSIRLLRLLEKAGIPAGVGNLVL